MAILILSAVIVAQGIVGLAVALIVHSDRQRLAVYEHRLESADAAYNRLANDAIELRSENDRLASSLRDRLTGGCDKHAKLPMQEFLRKGGAQCPVCLMEEMAGMRKDGITPPPPNVVGTIRGVYTPKPNPILPTDW